MTERERERKRYEGIIKSTKMRKIIWGFLIQRDGAFCQICHKTLNEAELVINHIDGDPKNNDPSNLNILCKSDNLKHIWSLRMRHDVSTPNSVCVKIDEGDEGARVEGDRSLNLIERELVASAEIKLNRDKEPEYRSYIFSSIIGINGEVKDYLSIDEAIYGGAEKVHISPVTARRYLQKLTSGEGPLWIEDNKVYGLVLAFKSNYWTKLSMEIEKK